MLIQNASPGMDAVGMNTIDDRLPPFVSDTMGRMDAAGRIVIMDENAGLQPFVIESQGLVHEKEIHQCNTCGKVCSSAMSLKRHDMIHTGSKFWYPCPECGKKFNQKANMKSHLKTHSGEKPFECPACHQFFSLNGNLTKHKARCTGSPSTNNSVPISYAPNNSVPISYAPNNLQTISNYLQANSTTQPVVLPKALAPVPPVPQMVPLFTLLPNPQTTQTIHVLPLPPPTKSFVKILPQPTQPNILVQMQAPHAEAFIGGKPVYMLPKHAPVSSIGDVGFLQTQNFIEVAGNRGEQFYEKSNSSQLGNVRMQASLGENRVASSCVDAANSFASTKSDGQITILDTWSSKEADVQTGARPGGNIVTRSSTKVTPPPDARDRIRVVPCEVCGVKFAETATLTKHMKTHHEIYNCPSCKRKFPNATDLLSHMTIHEAEMNHQESLQVFTSEADLGGRMIYSSTENGGGEFCTETTSNDCLSIKKFGIELGTEASPIIVQPISDSQMNEVPNIVESQSNSSFSARLVGEIVNVHMNDAEKGSAIQGNLQSSVATNIPDNVCPECGKEFASKNKVDRHMAVHTGEKPYACPECDRTFTQKASLDPHMLTHTGERKYVCPICQYPFTLKGNMMKHVQRHYNAYGSLANSSFSPVENSLGLQVQPTLNSLFQSVNGQMNTNVLDSTTTSKEKIPTSADFEECVIIPDDDEEEGKSESADEISYVCVKCCAPFRTDNLLNDLNEHSRYCTGGMQSQFQPPLDESPIFSITPVTVVRNTTFLQNDDEEGSQLSSFAVESSGQETVPIKDSQEVKTKIMETNTEPSLPIKVEICEEGDMETGDNTNSFGLVDRPTHLNSPGACSSPIENRENIVETLQPHTPSRNRANGLNSEFNTKCSQEANLKTPERTHIGEKPFVCSRCNKSFNFYATWESHILECPELMSSSSSNTFDVESRPQIKTEIDADSFEPLTLEVLSQNGNRDMKSFSCRKCRQVFLRKSYLVSHMKMCVNVDQLFTCSECNTQFSQLTILKRHMRIMHSDVKFSNVDDEIEHPTMELSARPDEIEHPTMELSARPDEIEHPTMELSARPDEIENPTMELSARPDEIEHPTMELSARPDEIEHPTMELSARPDEIEPPTVKLSARPNEIEHPTVKLSARPDGILHSGTDLLSRTDVECSETISDVINFNERVKIVLREASRPWYRKKSRNQERPYQCRVCGESFRQGQHRTTHMKIHTGEKPFKCSECGWSFITKQNLTSHMLTHDGIQSFKCGECDKTYILETDRDQHMKIHRKTFVCNDCNKRFVSSRSLSMHKRYCLVPGQC